MGNYKFRFADMIPNAWFYKLKDLSKPPAPKRNQHRRSPPAPPSPSSTPSSSHPHQRKSYYITRDLNPPHPNTTPRKSAKKKISRRSSRASPRLVSGCSCRATSESVWANPADSTSLEYPVSAPPDSSSSSSSFSCTDDNQSLSPPNRIRNRALPEKSTLSSSNLSAVDDIVIDVDSSPPNIAQFDDAVTKIDLPPIVTKEEKRNRETAKYDHQEEEEEEEWSPKASRRSWVHHSHPPAGLKLRTSSPRIANRRIKGARKSSSSSRRSLSDSLAVVKSSKDPQKDFRESMLEMIVENNIWSSKELEDLLACYLSLNSDEYHHLIIHVFKQIWFDVLHSSTT